MSLENTFNETNYFQICDTLCSHDDILLSIIKQYGYPPYWTRPNTYETLVLTILEQQVSLASAYAAYKKLKELIGDILPETVLQLTDEQLQACYFSRQKIRYTKELATAIVSNRMNLETMAALSNEEVRKTLIHQKGIGNWTIDIYLIHALQRADIFPTGDLALVNGIKMLKNQSSLTKDELMNLSEPWKPFRSVATMMLWHYYIKKKNIKLLH
jgi:DNA-3-methyladenine glycosylase II